MTYQETVNYIENTLPQFGKIGGQAFHKGFENINALMDVLNHPHKKLKFIHVAGTNGKGSTCHLIAAYLKHKGYKVGLHTSPHLLDIRERFQIDGKHISKKALIDFIAQYKEDIEHIKPSFFELTVAMAFYYFHQENVDYAIVETGLGGRWDATNIIQPLMSIITNVSLDHLNILGDTIEKIAFEKGGIIKENTPVIIGLPEEEEAIKVFENIAKEKNSPIFKTSDLATKITNSFLLEEDIKALPYFQQLNIQTVYQALQQLKGIEDLSDYAEFLIDFFQHSPIIGRWQIFKREPYIILDVGHNEEALKNSMAQLNNLAIDNIHIIIGMMADKAVDQLLHYFPQNANYYFTQAQINRAMDKEDLQSLAKEHGLEGECYNSVAEAWEQVKNKMKEKDLLLVTGSFFIISDFLKANNINE